MKKFLAVLLSVVLCATVAYSVCAEEVAPEEDVVVVETEANPVADLADSLANDTVAQEKAEEIVEAIKTGSTSDDIVSLLGALEQYVNGAGFEVSDLQDAGAVRDVIDSFLEDAGVDSEELNQAISESTVANAVLGIYYSAPEVDEPVVDDPTEEIPDTGFRG
ncbi:MAG: hypothetical protein UH249_11055 [Acutalibacteraceae bacterium]|nr:hypothetical protein [Acutalibacteraceae bacterium]